MQRSEIVTQVRFSTLKTSGDISDAEIESLISLCVQEISVATHWSFLEKSTTITTVADDKDYSLPNDFLYAIALTDDDHDTDVEYIAPTAYFDRFGNDTDNTSGTADYWTIYNDVLILQPVPSAADADRYTLYYYKTMDDLSQDSDVPEFHEGFHYMIVDYCKWKIWEREEYFDQAERSRLSYYTALNQMQKWYMQRANRVPYIYGIGRSTRPGDPNIPSLYRT